MTGAPQPVGGPRTPIWEVETSVFTELHDDNGHHSIGFRTIVRVFEDGAREVVIQPAPGEGEVHLDRDTDEWGLVMQFVEALLSMRHIVTSRRVNDQNT
jgi:hypothetical protein